MALFGTTFNISNNANAGRYGTLGMVFTGPFANTNGYIQSQNPEYQQPGRMLRGGLGALGNDWRGWGAQRRNAPMSVTPGTMLRPVLPVRPHPLIRF
jgi:hypothetical protein